MKISVFIIAKNEEKNLERCLGSVRWADEIVVVDSGSRDATCRVAGRFTDKVFVHEFTDYASQKNFALSKTTGEWVLSLDADEEVSAALKEEMLALAATPRAADAYRVRRVSHIFGRRFRHTGTPEDRPVRFFKRDAGHFDQPIHEVVRVQGQTGCLREPIFHYTYPSVHDYLEKLNRYTSMEADLFIQKNEAAPQAKCYGMKSFFMFLRLYFYKGGFRDGIEGFFFSVFSAYYVFVKHAKHFEKLQRPL